MTKKRPMVRSPQPSEHPFTVVLLRPEYLGEFTEEAYGQDIYVAFAVANTVGASIKAAQQDAFDSDTRVGFAPVGPEDYRLCVLFEGHHDPRMFGWQV